MVARGWGGEEMTDYKDPEGTSAITEVFYGLIVVWLHDYMHLLEFIKLSVFLLHVKFTD